MKPADNSGKTAVLHNFPNYLLSDIEPIDSVSSVDQLPAKFSIHNPSTKLNIRAMVERALRSVISRKPKAYQPHPEQAPQYLLAYVTEELECGHSLDVHFVEAVEPLIAKRRSCPECASLPRKKPVQSVRLARKKAAGESPWISIAFAVGCGILLLVGICWSLQPSDFYQVTDRTSDFNHTLQQVHRGKVSAPAVMFWCDPQPFEAGHILTSFKFHYIREKYCYAVDSFSLLRDAATCPIVPKNCIHTNCADPMTDHIVCEGKPKFN